MPTTRRRAFEPPARRRMVERERAAQDTLYNYENRYESTLYFRTLVRSTFKVLSYFVRKYFRK